MDLREGLGRRSWRGQGGQWNEPVGTEKESALWCDDALLILVVKAMEVPMVVKVILVVVVMGF